MDESKYINIGGSSNLASVANLLVLLNNNLGELVKAEKEKNDILKDIKNKLSDIAAIHALRSGSGCYVVRAESENESGLRGKTCFQNGRLPKEGNRGYYYYRDGLKVEP